MSREAAESAERFDPEGGKSPEGEWRQRKQLNEPERRIATGLKRRSCPPLGQTSGGGGAEGGPGEESSREVPKWQARTVDPGMEASEREQPLQARERPLRGVGSMEEIDCGVPRGIDPEVEKSALGERNGEALSATSCGALSVHAGRGQGCESGHLEPLLFLSSLFSPDRTAHTAAALCAAT